MKNQEIITILEAMENKQSWFRKSFQEFLNAWAGATKGIEIESFRYLKIEEEEHDYGGYFYYLDMGYSKIYKSDWALMGQDEEEIELNKLPIDFLRKIAEELPGRITNHFKKIQSKIGQIDKVEKGLVNLTDRFI